MSDERPFTLRQIDQARGDFYALQDDLDFTGRSSRGYQRGTRSGAPRCWACSAGRSQRSLQRLEYPALKRAVRQQRDRFAASVLLIEDRPRALS